MKSLNFTKRDLNVNTWEATTPLGTYRITRINPDFFAVDYIGLDIARKVSTLSTDETNNFDAAVESAQRHSDKQIELIVDWVNNG